MKRSKFTEAQIAFVLKQAEEGVPVAEVLRSRRAKAARERQSGAFLELYDH